MAAILTIAFASILMKALATEIENNQAKLDQCQKFSQQYSAAVKVHGPACTCTRLAGQERSHVCISILHVSPPWLCLQDYELQLMTYRAFVESQQKSPMKRRRMFSSSDAITQEVGAGEEL